MRLIYEIGISNSISEARKKANTKEEEEEEEKEEKEEKEEVATWHFLSSKTSKRK